MPRIITSTGAARVPQPTVTAVTLLGPKKKVGQPWCTNFVEQRYWHCWQPRDSSPITESDNTRVPLDQQPSSILSHKNSAQTLTPCFLTSIWILLNVGLQSSYFFQVLRIQRSVHRPPMSPLPLDLYTLVMSNEELWLDLCHVIRWKAWSNTDSK